MGNLIQMGSSAARSQVKGLTMITVSLLSNLVMQ